MKKDSRLLRVFWQSSIFLLGKMFVCTTIGLKSFGQKNETDFLKV
jgi:hypothetical protein